MRNAAGIISRPGNGVSPSGYRVIESSGHREIREMSKVMAASSPAAAIFLAATIIGFSGACMKLLVIGAGMMGSAAAYDMARSPLVESVTLADADATRLKRVAVRINTLTGTKK